MERIEELEPSELFVQVRDFVANRGLIIDLFERVLPRHQRQVLRASM